MKDADGTELLIVKLPAKEKLGIKEGYAVQDSVCEYFRTFHHLDHFVAWTHYKQTAARFVTKAEAQRFAQETADGKFEPDEHKPLREFVPRPNLHTPRKLRYEDIEEPIVA